MAFSPAQRFEFLVDPRGSRAGDAYRVRWAPFLTDRIRAPHRAGGVEIRRCGAWCADAGQAERLFALPLGRCMTG